MSKLLSLDLSTSCTGFAIFDKQTKKLLDYGKFEPVLPAGHTKLKYPLLPLIKMQSLADQIAAFIAARPDIETIVVEEINRGISRMGQKVLDGFHFILLQKIQQHLPKILFRDSDGRTGWRPALGLVLGEMDKKVNAERKRLNKALPKGHKKLHIITKKDLACRFVNKVYGLKLNCEAEETDGDRADAIGLGHSIIQGL